MINSKKNCICILSTVMRMFKQAYVSEALNV